MCSPLHSGTVIQRYHALGRWVRVLTIPLLALSLLGLAQEQEEHTMTIVLKSPEAEEYQQLDVQVEALSLPDHPAEVLPPVPDASGPYYRLHGNSEQNGRVDATLPAGEWALAWEQTLRPGFVPEAVLCSGDRLLVQTGVWQLFSLGGELLREGSVGSGGITLDAEKSLFYHMDKMGDLAGRNLSDGEQAFAFMPFLGEEFSRTLIRRVDDNLLLVGIERQLDPHGHKKASRTLLEWYHLGDMKTLTVSGMLATGRNEGTLILPSTRTMTATTAQCTVTAAPGHLYFTTPEAAIARAFGGDLQPVALSLGGNEIAYLVVREGDRLNLLCLAEDGHLLRRYTFPEGVHSLLAPPLVGFDGRIYLLLHGTVIALAPDMSTLWESSENGPNVGATITRNGQLVVSGMRSIGILDPTGAYQPIAGKAETDYCTAPIVTDSGEIAVASKRQLHVFHTKKD